MLNTILIMLLQFGFQFTTQAIRNKLEVNQINWSGLC